MKMMIACLFCGQETVRSESITYQKQKDCKFANSRVRISE